MIKFRTFYCEDQQVFHHEAFSMLIPDGWEVHGGMLWRQHATMPGAIQLSVRSPEGLYELNFLPSMPYCWTNTPFGLSTMREGTYYMGNQVRRIPQHFVQYLTECVFPQSPYRIRVVKANPSHDLQQALYSENPAGFGCTVMVEAGTASLEYEGKGARFEGDITCGLVITQMPYGNAVWVADKMISTRMPLGRRQDAEKIFAIMVKSFRINLQWFHYYLQLVQSLTQYVMQDIYNAGVISRIVSNTYNQISDMTRRSYENQQASYDRIYKGISEGIRGVNAYYDPYKGYEVEVPCDYRYVYANPLGEYIFTNDAGFQPGVGSNLNWTILNRS